MEEKPRLLVYSRKEVVALSLLGILVAAFSFTLGIHLGKRVGGKVHARTEAHGVPLAETTHDSVPSRQELDEKSKSAEDTADESMTQVLHSEVTKTGIKLAIPHQVDLPTQTQAQKEQKEKHASHPVKHAEEHPPEKHKTVSHGAHEAATETHAEPPQPKFFALQVGVFPTSEAAQSLANGLNEKGLEPLIRAAGKKFRVVTGKFGQKAQAEAAGKAFVESGAIPSFVVVPFR